MFKINYLSFFVYLFSNKLIEMKLSLNKDFWNNKYINSKLDGMWRPKPLKEYFDQLENKKS